MRRIKEIEKPFMKRLFAAAFSVIAKLNEERNQKDSKLEQSPPPRRCPKHTQTAASRDPAKCCPLFLGIVPVTKQNQCIEHIKNRPVSKQREQTKPDRSQVLHAAGTGSPIPEPNRQQTQQQRIQHAKLRIKSNNRTILYHEW